MPTIKDIPQEKVVDLKEKIACVYDPSGLYVETAKAISKAFKKVYYYMPWKVGFPTSNVTMVGYGVEGIEKIENFFDHVDETDLFVFPYVYDGDLQNYLVSKGKLVWGSRKGEQMELYRDSMKRYMQKLGLYVTPYTVLVGTDALREYLKTHDNVYVKQNMFRGDIETFRSTNYKTIEPVLTELEHNLGAAKTIRTFIVENCLDDAVEAGVDIYCIDGEFPTETLLGIEVKDCAYGGTIMNYNDISKKLTGFYEKVKPALKNYQYRGFTSTEIRISKDKPPYMVDFTARQPSPPGELILLMYKNLPEIMWYGADGILIDPVTTKKYGAQACISSSWAEKDWQSIYFPKEYRDNIKIRNLCIIGDRYYYVPQHVQCADIGSIVTEGDSLEDAIEQIKTIAETIEGYGIHVKIGDAEKLKEKFDELEKYGVKIL